MNFKNKKHVVIFVSFLLIALAALGLIVWAVATHREAGLLQVCWVDGAAQYEEDVEGGAQIAREGCEKLVWQAEQVPLAVTALAPSNDGPGLAENDPRWRVLDSAVGDINGQLGFPLFTIIPGTHYDHMAVWVHLGEPFEIRSRGPAKRPPAWVVHNRASSLQLESHVYVRSDMGSSDRLLYLVLQHELLHAAGLAHDRYRSSVMYPFVRDDTDNDFPSTAHISDHDRRLLRRRYRVEEEE